jgi:hypothetical protein
VDAKLDLPELALAQWFDDVIVVREVSVATCFLESFTPLHLLVERLKEDLLVHLSAKYDGYWV